MHTPQKSLASHWSPNAFRLFSNAKKSSPDSSTLTSPVTSQNKQGTDIRLLFPGASSNSARKLVIDSINEGTIVGIGSTGIVIEPPKRFQRDLEFKPELLLKIKRGFLAEVQENPELIADQLHPIAGQLHMPGHALYTIYPKQLPGSMIGSRDFPNDAIEVIEKIAGKVIGAGPRIWGINKRLNHPRHTIPVLIDPNDGNFTGVASANIANSNRLMGKQYIDVFTTFANDCIDLASRDGRALDPAPGNLILVTHRNNRPEGSSKLFESSTKVRKANTVRMIYAIDTRPRDKEDGNRRWAPEPSLASLTAAITDSSVIGLLLAPNEVSGAPRPNPRNAKIAKQQLANCSHREAFRKILTNMLIAGLRTPTLPFYDLSLGQDAIYAPYRSPEFLAKIAGLSTLQLNAIEKIYNETRASNVQSSGQSIIEAEKSIRKITVA